MESSNSAPLPGKSKKPSTSSSRTKASGETTLISRTPDNKAPSLIKPNPMRNRGMALSISEVRKAAESLRQSNQDEQSGEIKSSRKQILSSDSPVKKPKGSDKLPKKCLDQVVTDGGFSPDLHCLIQADGVSVRQYILPEVIEIKRELVVDEQTSCMKPDLCITLNVETALRECKSASLTGPVDLWKFLYSRLLDFLKNHPEGEEIPKEPLPPPFNHAKDNRNSEIASPISSSVPTRIPIAGHQEFQAIKASHPLQSFQKRFSRNITADISIKTPPNNPMVKSKSLYAKIQIHEKTPSCPFATPIKETNSLKNSTPVRTSHVESTPAKLALTPVSSMSSTPALQPHPKRSCWSPEDQSTDLPPSKLLGRLPHNRSLKFDSPMKCERLRDEKSLADDNASYSNDVLDILSVDLVQLIREKERKAMERDPAISRATRRLEIIAELPKLFDTVHFLFQSSKWSVITREELIYQITTSRFDMVDSNEVEEELESLKELAPEWISEKVSSPGDVLFCVNKAVSASTVRAQLAEAK